jgi:putative nucleotidyltransferase with HDIG domain
MLLKKASLVIENRALYETIYLNLVNTLRSLVSTIEAKDKYTQRHSERVTKIALLIARELRCAKEELDVIQFAGMLHDIGKIGVSDAILQKPSSLTKEEYETIKQHPIVGARILEPLGMLPHEKAIIRHHHERWDGKGYPDGLAGRDIPFLARIVSLADAYDAMTSDRVYRKGLTHEMAVTELEVNSWRQFDSAIVDAFKSLCARMGEQVKLELE